MAEFEVTAAAVHRRYHIQVMSLASCSNCKFFGIFFSSRPFTCSSGYWNWLPTSFCQHAASNHWFCL